MTDSLFGALRAPDTVVLGDGAAATAGEHARRFGARCLVCTDPFLAQAVQGRTVVAALRAAGMEVTVLDAAVAELPRRAVERAIERARGTEPDVIVGLGGGSSIDLAKLVALGVRHGGDLRDFYGEGGVPGPVTPLIAIPTTAGTGSEVTPVAVLSDHAHELKVGISSPHLIPRVALCDPTLAHGAPREVTAYAGIDALAHAIEAYCARRHGDPAHVASKVFTGGNVLTDGYALAAVGELGRGLRAALEDDAAGRRATMAGSLMAGLAFGTAGTAAAHALQYPIGAQTKTAHGLGVGLLLPYVMAYVAPACEARLGDVGRALGVDATSHAAIEAVAAIGRDLGIPASLRDLGMPLEALEDAARKAVGIERLMRNSPREVDLRGARRILAAAWHGDRSILDRANSETT